MVMMSFTGFYMCAGDSSDPEWHHDCSAWHFMAIDGEP